MIVSGHSPSDVLRGVRATRVEAERAAAEIRVAFADAHLSGWETFTALDAVLQPLATGIAGKSDAEIQAVAHEHFNGIAPMVAWMLGQARTVLRPDDCTVAFIVDDDLGWVFTSAAGRVTVSARVPRRAPATVRCTFADFVRAITKQIDWADLTVEGDRGELERMLREP